jgi:hypothetical protein
MCHLTSEHVMALQLWLNIMTHTVRWEDMGMLLNEGPGMLESMAALVYR